MASSPRLVFATNTVAVSFRRGWTHGIVAQIGLPIALTGACWLVNRIKARHTGSGPPFRAGWTLLLSYIGVYSHVFLDYLNNYGVRLLTPFDWTWFYGDSVFIIDPWLWIVLGTGVWLARRRHAPSWARRLLPGPRLFEQNAHVIDSLYVGSLVAILAQIVVGIIMLPLCIWLVNRPQPFLSGFIFALILSGLMSLNNSTFDLGLALAVGLGG